MAVMEPTGVDKSRQTMHSSRIDIMIKQRRCITQPACGFPTYSTQTPGPAIAIPYAGCECFLAPFGVWRTGSRTTGAHCRPIMTEEVADWTKTTSNAPYCETGASLTAIASFYFYIFVLQRVICMLVLCRGNKSLASQLAAYSLKQAYGTRRMKL
jgi:hypothetical protein